MDIASYISGGKNTGMIVKLALADFYERSQLAPDGGVNDNWVKLKFGPLYIPFPNLPARKKAVMYHDIHHLVTGYPTTWQGEAMIGAWEVSSGCGDYRAAWIFDMGIFSLGFFLFPVQIFRAFIRGRQSSNFYHHLYTYEQVLEMDIATVRATLHLDQPAPPATYREVFEFAGWWLLSLVTSFTIFVLPVAILIGCIIHMPRLW